MAGISNRVFGRDAEIRFTNFATQAGEDPVPAGEHPTVKTAAVCGDPSQIGLGGDTSAFDSHALLANMGISIMPKGKGIEIPQAMADAAAKSAYTNG